MMHGLLQIVAVVRAVSMTRIAGCNKVPNTSVRSAGIHTIFGLSPMAIAAVAENMKCCEIRNRLKIFSLFAVVAEKGTLYGKVKSRCYQTKCSKNC